MNWKGAEIYNPESPDDVKDSVLRENMQRIGSALSKANVNLLTYAQKKDTKTYDTGGAWIEISEFSKGITVSGGIVEINASLNLYTNNVNYYIALLVNNETKISKRGLGSDSWQTMAFCYCDSIPSGRVSVKIMISCSGSVVLNSSTGSTTSEMVIKEYLF